jgi:signal transduction histidine kinase
MGTETPPLWRALAVFRVASGVWALVLMARSSRTYPHPMVGWADLAVMAVWTVAAIVLYSTESRRAYWLLITDFVVTAGCLLASLWAIGQDRLAVVADTVPMAWVASPVLAWGLARGRLRAALAAFAMGGVDAVTRGTANAALLNDIALLLLAGVTLGHASRLAAASEANLQRVAELEAANRERERIARGIHDSVLQVLTLVHRRGMELGGDAAELGRLAGEQEAALRNLVATDFSTVEGVADLRALLRPLAGDAVSLAAPATPVMLPGTAAREIAAAVGSALDNVRAHAGSDARAYVLVEDEPAEVTVTVRDDGDGMPAGRLHEAAADGRLGVARSIRGRVTDLGGTVTITSAPGDGTEVEIHLPRPRRRP